MPNVLLEIGMEEVPARFVDSCVNNLHQLLEKKLISHGLSKESTKIQSFSTYRRFAFIIDDVKDSQDDVDQVVQGPPLTIAKDSNGDWQPPAIGFAKKNNVDVNDLNVMTNDKNQEVLSVRQWFKGQKASVVLPIIFKDMVSDMKLPIAMTWGSNQGPFIRPVHWVCSLIDNDIIDWELFGVQSSNISYGHRFLSKNADDLSSGKSIPITSPSHYVNELDAFFVMVDPSKRRETIHRQLMTFIADKDIDLNLLKEVTQLSEWPTVLEVQFSKGFLTLPKDALVECLKKHQKAFMVTVDDQLKHSCLVIADSVTDTNRDSIIEGNQRVLQARLNDIHFFWEEDIKTNGFSLWNKQLESVVFQDNLGSIADKVERVCHLTHTISDQLNIPKDQRKLIDRAAHRCKSDLVSHVVKELPNLQGIMGGFYAVQFSELPEVALAIREHYLPRFDGDEFPTSILGLIIGIADRLDTMVACFENNLIPTGSRDPWGIRRSMLAIIRMIVQKSIHLNLVLLIEDATLTLGKELGDNTKACLSFFKKRIETVFVDEGIPVDMIQFLYQSLLKDPGQCFELATQLLALKSDQQSQYELLIDTATRVKNIVATFDLNGVVDVAKFSEPIERRTYDQFEALDKTHVFLLSKEHINQTLVFCNQLRDYFEHVLVNDEDDVVANNRRLFIKMVDHYFSTVGDWSSLIK